VYFKRWIDEMEKQGADLSQVKIKGTEVSLYYTVPRRSHLTSTRAPLQVKLWFIERANTLHSIVGHALTKLS